MKLDFILYFFSNPDLLKVYFIILGILGLLFMFGIGGTITGIILYFMLFFVHQKNNYILDGSDNVLLVVLPFLLLANSYSYFIEEKYFPKFEARLRANKLVVQVAKLFCLGLMIQVCFVYFFTAVAKSEGSLWQKGTALYYVMRVEEFRATSWNIPLTENIYFVVIGTYFTMLVEIAMPFLVWFKRTKFFILLLMSALHIGIWIFMRIDNFSTIMIATYFVFFTDKEYQKAIETVKSYFLIIKNRIYEKRNNRALQG
ncbi:MAG: restriction endonuclease subunit S [Saprospiraceae bacterium]